jgi:hypothetical protein
MKLSDTFDCTEGGADDVASGPVVAVAVDAAEMDDEEADGAGEPLFALEVKSDINVDDDDLIESSTDAADAETDLYMDSNLDDMLSSLPLPLPLLQVRSVDAGFLCLGCFEIVDAIF